MNRLFDPLTLRGVTLPHRLAVSPMCQYSAVDGHPNDWHLVHLGSRAVGGAALILLEATGVTPEGRITPGDLGIWSDGHVESYARITRFLRSQGCVPGIQIAHAGRKASTAAPWEGGGAIAPSAGGWTPLAPSPIPFADNYALPREMTLADIAAAQQAFAGAAKRALAAGFQVVEIHAAHGYLLHEFLSPLSNHRTDAYGGSFDARIRMLLETAQAVRAVWPEGLPLFVRISTPDWDEQGWTVEESIELSRRLKMIGTDLIDCSAGGSVAHPKVPSGSGYQTANCARVRREGGIATAAVGSIVSAAQAEHILLTEQADLVFMARQMLRDPYMAIHAAQELGVVPSVPVQYERALGKSVRRLPLEPRD